MEEIERLVKIETEVQSIKSDIHTLFKKTDELNQMATAIALLTSSVNELKTTVSALTTKLDKVSEEPIKEQANKWNDVIKLIIAGIVSLGFGYIGIKIGISK